MAVGLLALGSGVLAAGDLEKNFVNPPDSARPWVFCFWLDGNVTKEGITADLEAMKRTGIGGTLIMDGSLGNPQGPARFLSPEWRELFKHFVAESARLGLDVNMNNDGGWAGSGGPWIKPDQAMRKVVVSETVVEGASRFDSVLPLPAKAVDSYHDIAVLAFPEPKAGTDGKLRRLDAFHSSKSFGGGTEFAGCVVWPRFIDTSATWPQAPREECVPVQGVVDLTERMTMAGRLTWEVPAGRWIIQRVGHVPAGGVTRMAQRDGAGLECDKMSKAAVETHFNAMMAKLIADVGPLAGKVLVSTHSDSWEAGSGNWTDGFLSEFHKRRGYDPLRYLPVLNGIVVESLEVAERFLWDWRQTAADLMVENYAGHLGTLARKHGLRLSIEAYDGPCDDLRYAGRADEPMCEFWQGGMYGAIPPDLAREMASAAHTYGKRIVGAEAFTDWGGKKFSHPALLKPLGDWAFCEGVNRFVITEWALQPWTNRWPGVFFSTIGTKYERTLTWWEYSKPWHQYLARCQYLLRQGLFVADVCFLSPEGAPSRFVSPIPAAVAGPQGMDRPEYDYDGCNAEVVLTRMSVQGGRIVLPDGMSYSLLVLPSYDVGGQPVWQLSQQTYRHEARPLPKNQTMTAALLAKIKELVESGATVLGTRPLKSPSLTSFPECDREVTRIADELWGKDAGTSGSGERRVGKGRVVWGQTPEAVLAGMSLVPDFRCGEGLPAAYRYIHRRVEDGTEIYFVANKNSQKAEEQLCSFRVSGKQPELWHPETGRIMALPEYSLSNGCTKVRLRLEPAESVFVVFRNRSQKSEDRDQKTKIRGRGQNFKDLKSVQEIAGPWEVVFDPKWGGPGKVTFEKLGDWSKRSEAGIKYYSGTAVYRTTFQAKKSAAYLDLGKVEVMADVTLNGKSLGILWKPPYRVDVTKALKDGENVLELKVVNLWINRLIGDEQLPEDSDRKRDGSLKSWPQWMQEGKPSPTGRFTFSSWRLCKKNDPLVESGLLGPVTILTTE